MTCPLTTWVAPDLHLRGRGGVAKESRVELVHGVHGVPSTGGVTCHGRAILGPPLRIPCHIGIEAPGHGQGLPQTVGSLEMDVRLAHRPFLTTSARPAIGLDDNKRKSLMNTFYMLDTV